MNTSTYIIDYSTVKPALLSDQLLSFTLITTETFLIGRLLLKLFELHQATTFLAALYSFTGYLVLPFTNLLAVANIQIGSAEWATVLAIISYWLFIVGIKKLFTFGKPSLSKIERARALSRKKYGH